MKKSLRINGIFNLAGRDHPIEIFGYSTKGVPGLEIVGLGTHGRVIREKFIYLSRTFGVSLPLKRFILCLENHPLLKQVESDGIKWLELPLLILFWSLGERLNFIKLEDCFACGAVSSSGKIYSRFPSLNEEDGKFFISKSACPSKIPFNHYIIIEDLFEEMMSGAVCMSCQHEESKTQRSLPIRLAK